MKKYLVFLLVSIMLISSSSLFAADSIESKNPSNTLVSLAINYTGSGFMTALMNGLEEKFKNEGYQFEVASAEGDALKQMQQIENFVSMNSDLIIVMPVDSSGLTDVCKRAMEAGTKIMAFTKPTGNYNIFLGSSDIGIGKQAAEMGAEWVNENFPSKEKINAAIIEYKGEPRAADRAEGLEKISEISDRIKLERIVEVGSPSFINGQSAAENLFQTNPNINMILAHNSGLASGINAYIMSPGSVVKEKSKVGVFAVDYDQEAAELIKKSSKNESVFRGTISLGSLNDIIQEVYDYGLKVLNDNEIKQEDVLQKGIKVTPKFFEKK